jgi:hypothetical protein
MQKRISAPLFSEKMDALAEKWQVGTPVKVYRSGTIWPFVIGFLMSGGLIMLLLLTLQHYLSVEANLDYLGSLSLSAAGRYVLVSPLQRDTHLLSSLRSEMILLAFLLAFWISLLSLYMYASFCLRIYVCSRGVLRVFGPKVTAIRWSQVVQVSWRSKALVRFFLADGMKYTWLNLGLPFPELAQEVNSRLHAFSDHSG